MELGSSRSWRRGSNRSDMQTSSGLECVAQADRLVESLSFLPVETGIDETLSQVDDHLNSSL